MAKLNCRRKGCKDVWNAFLVSMAYYAGLFEFPVIQPTRWVPNRLVAFSKAIRCNDFDQWVHFFEDDYLFERLWRQPKRYLPILKRYNGVILPDFSVYRDMPLVVQLYNIYRSRAVGAWLQANGVKVIVNVRYGDGRTYRCCCDGIAGGCTIAVGSHGTLRDAEDERHFSEGLEAVVKRLKPSTIVVYGAAPDAVFGKFAKAGINIVQFESSFAEAHKESK